MSISADKLYKLLPAVYRIRDDEMGGPLKALVSVIAEGAKATEDNITELYENWFIETCQEWVVPYIGDLMGVRSLHAIPGSNAISQRAYVANTIGYRRRKGIAPVLEQLAMDTTGWRAHVTEYFEQLGATQYMNHIRPQRLVAPDLRKMNTLDLVDGPFDTMAHSVDVRHISNGRGKYNIPNIGLAVWRVQSYPVTQAEPMPVACSIDPAAAYFTFDPSGRNVQLFNQSQTERDITHISTETNVPGLLRRRALHDELEARRQALVDGAEVQYGFFNDQQLVEGDPESRQTPVFEIYTSASEEPIPPEEILICNLETCCTPVTTKTYQHRATDGTITNISKPITVVADPVSGRLLFTNPAFAKDVRVSYSYGFSGDTGSGPYNKQETYEAYLAQLELTDTSDVWHVGVSKTLESGGSEIIFETLVEAVEAWNLKAPGATGIISIIDSATYAANIHIKIPDQSRLLVIAADWPLREDLNNPVAAPQRVTTDLAASDVRPLIKGNVAITGTAATNVQTGGTIALNGLLIEGDLTVLAGNLNSLDITHTTQIPDSGDFETMTAVSDPAANQWLRINLYRSIIGKTNLHDTALESFTAKDSIIHCTDNLPGAFALKAQNVPVNLSGCTIIGQTIAKSIEAENCIFTDTVKAIRRQTGCIRYSFVPGRSPETPRRYRCQPELAVTTIVEALPAPPTAAKLNAIWNFTLMWLVPGFTSLKYGHHGYAQLSRNCPQQVAAGADDGTEMGAFYYLKQPQRMANLNIALEEYLSLGLEAGVAFIT